MAITITASQLWDKVRRIAERRPNNLVTQCRYVRTTSGDPVCLVGQAVAQIVNDQSVMRRFFTGRVNRVSYDASVETTTRNGMGISELWDRNSKLIELVNDSDWAVDALDTIQKYQDTELQWGDALDRTIDELGPEFGDE